jgi:hypothetical protein
VPKIVAVGDVHGEYDKLITLLTGTGMIDRDLNWIGGDSHLAFVGDMVDRGPGDRAVLDLVRRLQTEAEVAGGRVHPLLGNHEVMNMTRDLRYVTDEGYASFADLETEKDRKVGWRRYFDEKATLGVTPVELRAAFDEHHPPGYFGRVAAFGVEGEYGSWLLTQPVIVKINGNLFVHGGLTSEIAALGMDTINGAAPAIIMQHVSQSKKLRSKTSGVPTYETILAAAESVLEVAGTEADEDAAAMAKALVALADDLPFSDEGPLWYRGNSLHRETNERSRLDHVLELLDAHTLVVGHTPTRSGQITSRFNGKLLRADVGMAYGRNPQCLVLEDDDVRVFDPEHHTFNPPIMEHPLGEGTPVQETLTPKRLEKLLAKAKVAEVQDRRGHGRHVKVVTLESKGLRLHAVFQFSDERLAGSDAGGITTVRRYQHEIASYLLDRHLGFNLVPVTVARKIEGTSGSLQILLDNAVDLVEIQTYWRWDLARGLEQEINRARIFSALLGARDRDDAGKLLLPKEHRVMIADNTLAFSLSPEIVFLAVPKEAESFLAHPCTPMGPAMRQALVSLRADELQGVLGKYVSGPQIDALLQRRDTLLEMCTGDTQTASAGRSRSPASTGI